MSSSPSDETLVGSMLGDKYRLVRVLGRGGMATVYEAEHEGVEKRFAVKVLAARFASDGAVAERFRNEAKAANVIASPHVVTYLDVGAHDGVPYAVMELLEGEDLGKRLRREGTLPFEDIVRIAEQVLAALEVAHARGVVHRDLKPDNVFLEATDGAPRVKLLDFGISKRMETDLGLTREGTVLGTAHYMAPEQVESRAIDGRTDLYSLGATMYECITGRPPHVAETYEGIVVAIVSKEPPPMARYRADVPAALAHVVERALARDSATRWEDANAMRAALHVDPPEVSHEAHASTPLPTPRARGPGVAVMAVLLGVVAAALVYLAISNEPAVQSFRASLAGSVIVASPAPRETRAIPSSTLPSPPPTKPAATLQIDRTLP